MADERVSVSSEAFRQVMRRDHEYNDLEKVVLQQQIIDLKARLASAQAEIGRLLDEGTQVATSSEGRSGKGQEARTAEGRSGQEQEARTAEGRTGKDKTA